MSRLLLKVAIATVAAVLALAAGAAALGPPDQQLRSLSGRVLNQHDDPLAQAIVYLKNTRTLVVKTYISDADGSYRFPALSPNIDYEIYAEFKGARSDTKTLSAFDNRKAVTLMLRIKGAK